MQKPSACTYLTTQIKNLIDNFGFYFRQKKVCFSITVVLYKFHCRSNSFRKYQSMNQSVDLSVHQPTNQSAEMCTIQALRGSCKINVTRPALFLLHNAMLAQYIYCHPMFVHLFICLPKPDMPKWQNMGSHK